LRVQTIPLLLAVALLFGVTAVQAATLTLPDSTQTSTMQATIREGMTITVPSLIDFGFVTIDGTNKSIAVTTAPQTVTLTGIALTGGKKVKVSLQANSVNFVDGGALLAAADVSWNAATWTQGTGTAGTLSNAAFNEVGHSNINPAGTVTTTNLLFTLGVHDFAAAAVQAGPQTLVVTWKVESF